MSAPPAPAHRLRAPRANLITVASILAGGLLLLALNYKLPITRNAFEYAKASQYIIELRLNPLLVVATPSLSYAKPIGFSLLGVPFNLLFGPNLGMQLTSFLGTVLFVLAAWAFFAWVNRDRGIDSRYLPLQMALLFGNPLMMYQFWSAYPDTLFAAQVLIAFLLTDRIARGRSVGAGWTALLLGVVIYLAILTKLYALILGLACPLYIIVQWLGSRPAPATIKAQAVWLMVVFGLLGGAIFAARKGWNPTIDFGASADPNHSPGYEELEAGLGALAARNTVQVLASWGVALIVSFGVSLLFLSWRRRTPIWPRAWTVFIAVFLVGLLPFGLDIVYNIRYVIPVFPFVVVAISSGFALGERSVWRSRILVTHAGITTLLTLHYNVPRLFEALAPLHEVLLDPSLGRGDRLDNLRMGDHLRLARLMTRINTAVEPGGLLYWRCKYSIDATHGVIEDLIRRDIIVQYGSLDTAPYDRTIYVAQDVISPWFDTDWKTALRHRFRLTPIADGLVRVEPQVALASPREEDVYSPGDPVALAATVPEWNVGPTTRTEFLIDGAEVAVVCEPPYEATWPAATAGRLEAAVRIYTENGDVVQTTPRPFFVGVRAVERHITVCRDDAEQALDGRLRLSSPDLEIVRDEDLGYYHGNSGAQIIGLRFPDITVPHGARIKRAYLQLTAAPTRILDGPSNERTVLELRAELSANAARFTAYHTPGSRRTGSAVVRWLLSPWLVAEERSDRQRTPDLSSLIQEVVAQPGWQSGNAVVLVVGGFGRRVAKSCDGASATGDGPSLYIEYESAPEPEPAIRGAGHE